MTQSVCGRAFIEHVKSNIYVLFEKLKLLKCFMETVCNRYILEGKELEFYMKKIQRKKGKGAGAA